MYDPAKSLLLQLRDAAKVERDELTKFKLRGAADDLDIAIREFKDAPNGTHLTVVNSQWARSIRALSFASPVDPAPGGGSVSERAAA